MKKIEKMHFSGFVVTFLAEMSIYFSFSFPPIHRKVQPLDVCDTGIQRLALKCVATVDKHVKNLSIVS
jgi:hypothetical protein